MTKLFLFVQGCTACVVLLVLLRLLWVGVTGKTIDGDVVAAMCATILTLLTRVVYRGKNEEE